jgi:predicted transcriptional regulator
MKPTLTKSQIVSAVAGLPEDATVEDAIERLLFLSRIEEGLEQVQRGETTPHEEVKRQIEAQIASWQK